MENTTPYVASFDGNFYSYQFKSIEEALNGMVKINIEEEESKYKTCYIGKKKILKFSDFATFDFHRIADDCTDSDYGGECSDRWEDMLCSKQNSHLEDLLNLKIKDVINQFADEHDLQPDFYGVVEVQEYNLN